MQAREEIEELERREKKAEEKLELLLKDLKRARE